MRIVVGSGSSTDVKQAELDRHLEILSRFIARVESDGAEPRTLTMILRSAASTASLGLIGMSRDLARAGIVAKAVVASLEPEEDLRRLFASLSELCPADSAKELIRWARDPRLLDAHEQVTYGATVCWSGDAMRREADKRNALSLFDESAPRTALLAQRAFEALWSASTVVAERRLIGPATVKPSGAYEADPESLTAVSPLRPSLQGWPLLRH
jgi:hypothetical protein